MKYFFLLYAFRNLYRNKTKSLLMILTIFLVLFLTIVIKSYQKGTENIFLYDLILSNISKKQIITINETNTIFKSQLVENFKGSPRLENIIFIKKNNSFQTLPKIFLLRGIDIHKEKKMIDFEKYLTQKKQSFLKENHIYMGEKNAIKNNYFLGDTLIFEYQSTKKKVIIAGLFHTPNPFLNEKIIISSLSFAQNLFSCEDCLTSFQLFEEKNIKINHSLKIQTWQQSMPDIAQMLLADSLVWDILLFILYVLTALSFVGMMNLQIISRKNEFLNLYYLGVLKYQIIIFICFECFFYFVISLFLAFIFTFPLLFYWEKNPIELTGIIAENLKNIGLKPVLAVKIELSIFIEPIKIIFYFLIFEYFLIFFQIKNNIFKSI
ncbi:MAG: hypothetical protein EAZ20_03040 [Bacteroidetes bacterium]|nr:MAG: hypothetical protein EAZ20_03040 [Bacteroidota bacterium]